MPSKPGQRLDVVIAILTWRGEAMSRRCLASLRRPGGWTGPTLVVDNGSGTGEGPRLAAEFGVESLSLPANGGVPGGYNAAIKWAHDQGATHILLANNDLEFPDPDLATRLMAHAAEGVAAVGPIIRDGDGSIWFAGGRLHRWSGHAERTHVPWESGPYDVTALEGSCMLVSIDAVCRIGGLAPEFFLYWEETDWCTRARRAGLRLLVDPEATVTHVGRASGSMRQTRRYALRNSLLYVRRNLRGLPGVTASLAWLFGRLPIFLVRSLNERADPRGIVADAGWAVGWHLRDASRHGWRQAPEGPDLCD